jgi:predicted AAA+ superfamily ATPase
LRQLAAYYPAIVVTGARQAGKTTLLRHTFPDHTYVSLDLPSTAELAERDREQFLRSHPQPIIVDEVQYAPALFRHLKRAIDADRHQPLRRPAVGDRAGPVPRTLARGRPSRTRVLPLVPRHLP